MIDVVVTVSTGSPVSVSVDDTFDVAAAGNPSVISHTHPIAQLPDLHSSVADYIDFPSVAAMVADTALTYTSGSANSVSAGVYITVKEMGFTYSVLSSAASSYDLITAGGVKLSVVPNSDGCNVKAWNAKGDGLTDDTAAIQGAINAGSVIYFEPGKTYRITSTLDLSAGNKTLFGNGATIDQSGIASGNKFAMQAIGGLSSTTSTLTANCTTSSYSATVTSASGFSAGDWVLIGSNATYDNYNPTYSVAVGEFVRIRSISSNTLYFTTPTKSADYNTADSAFVTKASFCNNIRVSGLTFQGRNTPGAGERGLVLQYVNGFAIEDCSFIQQDIYQLELTMSIRGDVTNNMFYGVYYDGVTGTIFYGVFVGDSSQYINIGDNIFERVRHGVITSAKTSGQNAWGQPLYINIHHNQMYDAQAGGAGRSWGFEHHGFGLYVSFNNNMVDGAYGGVNIDAAYGVEVLNNVFTNISHYGVDIGGSAKRIGNILISGNHISRETNDIVATSYGVFLESGIVTSATDIVISDNFIIGFDQSASVGIYIGSTTTNYNLVVKNNTIATGASGQDADSGYGIAIYAAETEVIGNTICNYKQGIYVNSTATRAVIKGNINRYDTSPTSGYSIYTAASHSIVDGNTLVRPYVGIRVETGATSVLVSNNTQKSVVSSAISDGGTTTLLANNQSN